MFSPPHYLCSNISLFLFLLNLLSSYKVQYVTTEFKVNAQILLPSLSTKQYFEKMYFSYDHIFHFFDLLLLIHRIASFYSFSQTIIHISTEITKIKHHMNRTKHAHCSTTVLSTWQLTRAFTHFMQNSLHLLQNRLKFKKCLHRFVFLHFTNSSSEINTSFCLF